MKNTLFVLLFLVFSCSAKQMGTKSKLVSSKDFTVEKIYEGDGVVWGFDFVDESKLLVSHRDGELFLYNLKTKKKKKLSAPKVRAKGQGGLLDVKFKKVGDKSYVYLTFSEKISNDKVVTSLARGELAGDELKNLKTIFQSNAYGDSSIHFGSRLVFDDESIFMSVGERGERDLAQDINRHNGSILRLSFDGKAHPKNPFVGKDGADEIYSFGHRNPQGIYIDPVSGNLYNAEMGPRGGDELNWVRKGKNYGWPEITYGTEYYGPKIGEYKKKGMEQPVTYWVPSISPSGMVFYTGDKVKGWKNKLFLGCLSGTEIRMVELEENKVVSQISLFRDMEERFRHVNNGPDGAFYFATDSGKIYRVTN